MNFYYTVVISDLNERNLLLYGLSVFLSLLQVTVQSFAEPLQQDLFLDKAILSAIVLARFSIKNGLSSVCCKDSPNPCKYIQVGCHEEQGGA